MKSNFSQFSKASSPISKNRWGVFVTSQPVVYEIIKDLWNRQTEEKAKMLGYLVDHGLMNPDEKRFILFVIKELREQGGVFIR